MGLNDNADVKEVASFYKGARILVPFMITLAITVVGWIATGLASAKEKGVQEELIRQLTIQVAKHEGRAEGLEKRINNHDVVLGQFAVQLARIEKTGDESNSLINELVRNR